MSVRMKICSLDTEQVRDLLVELRKLTRVGADNAPGRDHVNPEAGLVTVEGGSHWTLDTGPLDRAQAIALLVEQEDRAPFGELPDPRDDALDMIQGVLSALPWSVDDLATIANLVRQTGRRIAELPG